jgi:hypothetical protein
MRPLWTVKDSKGKPVEGLTGRSRLEVGRKVVPTRFDTFRLHVSSSYRQVFDRTLATVLNRRHWKIVRLR